MVLDQDTSRREESLLQIATELNDVACRGYIGSKSCVRRSRQKRRLDSMYSMPRRVMTDRMSISRVLASTRRRTVAADIRMQSWMAFTRPRTAVRFDVHIAERKNTHSAGSGFHARNDGPFSHVHASPTGNRTNHMCATHAPK